MEEIRAALAPLTDWIPEEYLGFMPVEAWWMVELTAALALLLVAGYVLRGLLRLPLRLFRRRRPEWDRGQHTDLDSCPTPVGPPSVRVHHVPARLRLVVVAPGGTGVVVEEAILPQLLDRAVPGLGAVVKRDQPRICVWPAQLSTMGFTNSFHRCTLTGRREDEESEWVLLAGRARGRGQPLFLGLGLWTDEPTAIGRMNLEPQQWLDVLRLNIEEP
jgi:hypothetical protein